MNRKGAALAWAAGTIVLGCGLFAVVIPIFNREKMEAMGRAYSLLSIPVVAQAIWLAAGAVYSARRQRPEAILGMLIGVGVEVVAVVALVIISATAHY